MSTLRIRCSNAGCKKLFSPRVLLAKELSIPHRNAKATYYCCNCDATSITGRIWKRSCTECGKQVDPSGLYAVDGEYFHCVCFECKNKINPPLPEKPQEPTKSSDLYCFRCGELKNRCRSC